MTSSKGRGDYYELTSQFRPFLGEIAGRSPSEEFLVLKHQVTEGFV